MICLEYFHHTLDQFVTIKIPKSELIDHPDFIVQGIERYGARIVPCLEKEES